MFMFHLYYTGCVFVYLMYIYLSSEINIYLSMHLITVLLCYEMEYDRPFEWDGPEKQKHVF